MHSATVFFALAAVVAGVSAYPGGLGVAHDLYAYPSYKYSYGVADKHTGDQKSVSEVRDGDVTKGSYSFVQPDGVLRFVQYVVAPGHGVGHGIGGGLGGGIGGGLGGAGGYGLAAGGLGGLGGGIGGGLGGAGGYGLAAGGLGGLGAGYLG